MNRYFNGILATSLRLLIIATMRKLYLVDEKPRS